MKTKHRNKKKKKMMERGKQPKNTRLIVAMSIGIGLVLGFLLWYFVTRCKFQDCILYYFPLREFIGFGFLFWILPFALLNKEPK